MHHSLSQSIIVDVGGDMLDVIEIPKREMMFHCFTPLFKWKDTWEVLLIGSGKGR